MDLEEIEKRIREAHPQCEVVAVNLGGRSDCVEIRITEKSMDESFQKMMKIKKHQALVSLFSEELGAGDIHAMEVRFL